MVVQDPGVGNVVAGWDRGSGIPLARGTRHRGIGPHWDKCSWIRLGVPGFVGVFLDSSGCSWSQILGACCRTLVGQVVQVQGIVAK